MLKEIRLSVETSLIKRISSVWGELVPPLQILPKKMAHLSGILKLYLLDLRRVTLRSLPPVKLPNRQKILLFHYPAIAHSRAC